MVSVDLIMISTSQPTKQFSLRKIIPCLIDKFNFTNKIIGIDVIDNYTLDNKTENLLSNLNFIIDIHDGQGMVRNLGSVIDSLKSEWILYCEDDVILDDFPNIDKLLEYSKLNFSGEIGIIDFLPANGVMWNQNTGISFKHNFMNSDYHKIMDEYHLFERDIESYDMYYINFPIILIRKDIFVSCYYYALDNCKNSQIERGMSFAYYAMGYQKIYKKIHIWKNENLDLSECENLDGRQISYDYLMKKLLIKNRETHPDIKFLTNSVMHASINDRVSKIYSF